MYLLGSTGKEIFRLFSAHLLPFHGFLQFEDLSHAGKPARVIENIA